MLKLEKIGYSLKDVTIIPKTMSNVRHRGDVDPYTVVCGRKMLPIFVAPMAAVTDEFNYHIWLDNKVTPVLPRSVMERLSLEERLNIAEETFVAISLSEAEEFAGYEIPKDFNKKYICIDIANGHMRAVLDVCRKIKDVYGDLVEIMTGNIANPEIYPELYNSGISWIRCSIGSGARCSTANTTGVYYPSATLIDELTEIKEQFWLNSSPDDVPEYDMLPKIILDGGINWYDDINKALALGADAVMMGKMFAECEESCERVLYCKSEEDFNLEIGYFADELYDLTPDQRDELTPYRNYAGMSHRSMQKITGGDGSKVSEGIVKPVTVKYTVGHFLANVEAYLRSTMSYCSAFDLPSLKRNSEFIILGGSGRSVYEK